MIPKLFMFFKKFLVAVVTFKFGVAKWMLVNIHYLLWKGYAPYDIMDLDVEFLNFFLPRLDYFIEHGVGSPVHCSEKKFKNELKYLRKLGTNLAKRLRNDVVTVQDWDAFLRAFSKNIKWLWW